MRAIETIKLELRERLEFFHGEGKLVEAQRIEQRTRFDLEMLQEIGFCKGIENYSRHLSGAAPGEPPPTLIDYLPPDALMMIDESHVLIGQLNGMYNGDRARKENLVDYGFRLPSALDNRPLKFNEFERKMRQTIFVSATPADYEKQTGGAGGRAAHAADRPDRSADRGAAGGHAGRRRARRRSTTRVEAQRARAGDHADQAHGRRPDRIPRRARREGALSALATSRRSSASRSSATCGSASSTCWSASTCCAKVSICPKCRSSRFSTPTRKASCAPSAR